MAFFVDTFTEASDTLLSSHTPDTGTSWSLLWSDGASPTYSVIASTDRLKGTTANNSGVVYVANATYPSADYEVQVTWVNGSNISTRPQFIIARLQDIENMYALSIKNVSGGVVLYKKVSGTWTALSSAITIAIGSVIKLSVNGTTIKVFDDAVEVISVTDSDISGAGKAGLANGGGAELVLSTDDANSISEWDDFSVTDLGGGGQTVAIGLLSETNTIQPQSKAKSKSINQLTYTESMFQLSKTKSATVGILSETNSVQSLSKLKTKQLLQLIESASVFTIGSNKLIVMGMIEEGSSLQAIDKSKAKEIIQLLETNSLLDYGFSKAKAIGLLVENTELFSFSSINEIVYILGLLTENQELQTVSKTKDKQLSQLQEAEQLLPATRIKSKELQQLLETGVIFDLSHSRLKTLSILTEVENLLSLDGGVSVPVILIYLTGDIITTFNIDGNIGTTKELSGENSFTINLQGRL